MENWRRFINEEDDHKMGAMGTSSSEEKEKLRKKYAEAFKGAWEEDINQFLEVMIGKKPMYYIVVSSSKINFKNEELLSAISSNNLKLKFAKHTEGGPSDRKVVFFGKPENVNAALKLNSNPMIGKEKLGDYENEFWDYAHPRYIKVTPEWNRQLGILLGYGEENSKKYADDKYETQIPRLRRIYDEWKRESFPYLQKNKEDAIKTVALQEKKHK